MNLLIRTQSPFDLAKGLEYFQPPSIEGLLAELLPRRSSRNTDAEMEEADNDASPAEPEFQVPLVDILEEAERFVIRADVPGMSQEHIEVQMDDHTLTIRGERSHETRDEGGEGRFSRIERHTGSFKRQFVLPETIDADSIGARLEHGVLEITIPKRPETTPRTIEIATGA